MKQHFSFESRRHRTFGALATIIMLLTLLPVSAVAEERRVDCDQHEERLETHLLLPVVREANVTSQRCGWQQ